MIGGYQRSPGVYGIRNHAIVLSTVCCANSIVEQIAKSHRVVVPIIHQHGCDHVSVDRQQVLKILIGICNNPNVGGVLLVGLGCEATSVDDVLPHIDARGKIVRSIVIQDVGSKERILDLAKTYLAEIKEGLSLQRVEEMDISDLVVGLECGGSDPFSGITANPVVGIVCDKLVKLKATIILGEVPEMVGAEKVLEKRVRDDTVRKKLLERIERYVQMSRKYECDLLGINPTPGNIKSGLSTIEEKSLGCIAKAGPCIIAEFLEYGERPRSKGLVIMDTPGNDPESIAGMAAGGAHVIIFTTGLGTPIGNPVMPVIKVASNSRTYNHMKDFMDMDAGQIISGTPVSEVADRLFDLLVNVCNGKRTASEVNRSREIAINRLGPTF